MYIVSGEPRSGTSLAMETLRLLGLPVWGEEQSGQAPDPEDLSAVLRSEKAKQMNEKFWEIPGLVMNGISLHRLAQRRTDIRHSTMIEADKVAAIAALDLHVDEYRANRTSAVKIVWGGLPRTDMHIIQNSPIILAVRNPLHVMESQRNLEHLAKVAIETADGSAFISPKLPIICYKYMTNALRFLRWKQRPMNRALRMLTVDYDRYFDEPEVVVDQMIAFCGLDPTQEQRGAALANIDDDKRRSDDVQVPEGEHDEWHLAQQVYEMILLGEYESARSLADDYIEAQRVNPENARWLDSGNFWPMTPDLFRSMQEKPVLKQKMQDSFQVRDTTSALCTGCKCFNQSGSLYTIKTPDDMDDITRPRIKCEEVGEMTLEECQQHWTHHHKDPFWMRKHRKEG